MNSSGIQSLEPHTKGILSTQPTSCLLPTHVSIDKSHHLPPLVKVPPWLLITLRLSSSNLAWSQAPYWWPKHPLVPVSLTTCKSCSSCSKLLSWYNSQVFRFAELFPLLPGPVLLKEGGRKKTTHAWSVHQDCSRARKSPSEQFLPDLWFWVLSQANPGFDSGLGGVSGYL